MFSKPGTTPCADVSGGDEADAGGDNERDYKRARRQPHRYKTKTERRTIGDETEDDEGGDDEPLDDGIAALRTNGRR